MKKSVLVLGLVLSTMLNASPKVDADSLRVEEDLPTMLQKIKSKSDRLRVDWIQIQLKQEKGKDLNKGIRLLKELSPIIHRMERNLEK